MANIIGKDVTFATGDGASPEVFTEVAQVLSISNQQRTWNFENADYHGAADLAMRSLPTLFDEGEITIEMIFDSSATGHSTLQTRAQAATNAVNNYQIDFNGAFSATFAAYLANASWSVAKDANIKLSMTLRINGAVTWA